jgi:CheY-like chemotaxis protein
MQPPGAPTWDEVEEVRKAAERAAELTQQLLAFSRRQTIQPVTVDLNQLIQGVLKMLRRLIGERIELCFIPGDGLDTVRVDAGQIEQSLMNLSVNARDAMPRGGKLTIRTENAVMDAAYCRDNPWAAEGRYALITVTDTGRGMDAATRTRIFEPFYTTKEVGQGTGLGLATVYGIVKQHNGLIHVDSVPQKGTVFSVFLPAVESAAAEASAPKKQPVRGGNETILVAEDEPAVLNLIAALLRTVGYSVLTACDGIEAVRVFEAHGSGVDLAVLDMIMPGLSGREVMQRMKEMNPRTRFLFSSGYSPKSIHKDFIVEEGLHLLRKPYRREDLLLAVRQILDTQTAQTPSANGLFPNSPD